MTTCIALVQSLIFTFLANLHVYWALGGRAGLSAALPAHANGEVVFRPSIGQVWAVAVVLLLFAGLSAAHLSPPLAARLPVSLRTVYGTLAALLLLRGLGDFRFVGLSKRVRHTTFARLDTRYYSPLCLLLAVGYLWLAGAH